MRADADLVCGGGGHDDWHTGNHPVLSQEKEPQGAPAAPPGGSLKRTEAASSRQKARDERLPENVAAWALPPVNGP